MDRKIIVITGVSSGIGMAFVKKALNSGEFTVIGLGRKDNKEVNDPNYFFYKVDLLDERTIKVAVDKVIKKFKRVNVLINNAGFAYRSTFEDLSSKEMREQFEVNLFGPAVLVNLILSIMRKQNTGHIINVSSVASSVNTPTLGYYAATKVALDKLSEVLRQEVKAFGISVSLLIPGAVKTNFGKNIKLPKNYKKSSYNNLYSEWENRFRNFFNIRNTSDDVAEGILSLINKPQNIKYINNRDWVMCTLEKYLPRQLFHYLFLNYFYRNEG